MSLQTPNRQAIEERAVRIYFRNFGDDAERPNENLTEVFTEKGNQYVRLNGACGELAIYRLHSTSDGDWSLEYVGPPDGRLPFHHYAFPCGFLDFDPEPARSETALPEPTWWWSSLANLPTVQV